MVALLVNVFSLIGFFTFSTRSYKWSFMSTGSSVCAGSSNGAHCFVHAGSLVSAYFFLGTDISTRSFKGSFITAGSFLGSVKGLKVHF